MVQIKLIDNNVNAIYIFVHDFILPREDAKKVLFLLASLAGPLRGGGGG